MAYAIAVNVLVLMVGAVLLAFWWLRRSDEAGDGERDPVADWHAETASLVREVQRTVEVSEGVDHDRVQRQVVPLSNRIEGHARSAPAGVDERLVEDLHDLGVACYEVGMEHTTREAARTGVFLEDKLADLETTAERLEAAIASRSEAES